MNIWPWSKIKGLQDHIVNLQAIAGKQEAERRSLTNQVEYLVRTIRDMDQEIWNMGQKTDWNAQRPHFNKLHDQMITRKVTESNRINSLITEELHDTYKRVEDIKLIGLKP